jgi:hypothetical protein
LPKGQISLKKARFRVLFLAESNQTEQKRGKSK